jgi:hypothetical protein
MSILCELHQHDRFIRLFPQPILPRNVASDRKRLELVIAKLIEDGMASTPQVARAVGWVFGLDAEKLHNFFSGKLLEEWQSAKGAEQNLSDRA